MKRYDLQYGIYYIGRIGITATGIYCFRERIWVRTL